MLGPLQVLDLGGLHAAGHEDGREDGALQLPPRVELLEADDRLLPVVGPGYPVRVADPRMLQRLRRRHPLRRVDGQHLTDQLLGVRADRVPLRRVEAELSALKGLFCTFNNQAVGATRFARSLNDSNLLNEKCPNLGQ